MFKRRSITLYTKSLLSYPGVFGRFLAKTICGFIVFLVFGLFLINSSYADPTQISYDYWWGLNGWSYTIEKDTLFGLEHFRVWTISGSNYDGQLWQDSFVRIDTGIGVGGFIPYIGAEVLSSQSSTNTLNHAGPVAGARGEITLSDNININWDVALMPYDDVTTSLGSIIGGTGYFWSLNLSYQLSPSINVFGGFRQFYFWLPQQVGGGSNAWLGPYGGINIQF